MKLLWIIRTILREIMILKPLIWIFLLCFHLLNSLHKDWIVVYPPCSYHLMGLFLFSNIHFRGTITLQIGIRLQWAVVLILQSNPKRSIGCRGSQQWYEIQHYQLQGCWEARPWSISHVPTLPRTHSTFPTLDAKDVFPAQRSEILWSYWGKPSINKQTPQPRNKIFFSLEAPKLPCTAKRAHN